MPDGNGATIDADARNLLKTYAQRLMRLDEEIEGLKSDRKDLLKEVEGQGFDKGIFQSAVKMARDESAPAWRDGVAITVLYLDAIERDFQETPLGKATSRKRNAEDVEIITPGRRVNAPRKQLPPPQIHV